MTVDYARCNSETFINYIRTCSKYDEKDGLMFNAKEFIDDLEMDGFEREEAIQMAKDDLVQ